MRRRANLCGSIALELQPFNTHATITGSALGAMAPAAATALDLLGNGLVNTFSSWVVRLGALHNNTRPGWAH